ncbi:MULTISPECIES: DUF6787 family protein [Myroides]|uniref:Diacylglyceryl transferase n=1 Tax=Myroides albus TaxID=2562892 RepID=A0A6I3LL64_9FLAO|nr:MULTISPECIES: DUF6787 family protein [Myroides]MTG98256.1 diacylglyceryl transferase [Myroides albus]MVX35128.1 diacylglyceryl transferase [Myroides sp. LoEW2-1]UVD79018.1 diacylglyceryl transferase [Myroides albus]
MEKLKKRWGLTSNFQLVIVFIVFAITGSTAAIVSKPILAFLGIERGVMHPIPYWILYIIIIMPVYKVLLVTIGTIFGQHTFFWNFVKKMLRGMRLGFLLPKEKQEKEK